MSELRTSKKYDWKDSNLTLFASVLEKNVKKATEEVEQSWKGAGATPGITIWRIVEFHLEIWPKEDYGKFYSGDSYIILNTYKEETDELLYDLHFWIGKESTQYEYGTAAYKTVELDSLLNELPVQHREVQGFETDLFKSYFKTITVMKGGAQTGFRHVEPKEYKPRLFHFCGTRQSVEVKEVPLSKDRIKSEDVFILDLGEKIIQWNGSGSNKDERFKAMTFCSELESERMGHAKAQVFEDGQIAAEFFHALTDDNEEDNDDQYKAKDTQNELFRLSDSSGKMQFKSQKKGDISMADFDPKDVFMLDAKKSLFVWLGKDTSKKEKKNAMLWAHEYLMTTDHQLIPVSCINEGRETKDFRSAIAA